MNNGVTNNNTTQNETQNTLAPMAGVKIAPAEEGPVNASNKESAASAVNKQSPMVSGVTPAPVVSAPPVNTPVVNTPPVVAPSVQPQPAVAPTPEPPKPVIPAATPAVAAGLEVSAPPKKKTSFTPILLLIIIGLIGYIVVTTKTYTSRIDNLSYNCTPVTSSKEDKELDLKSTLVTDLYSKVATNIREDLAQPEFNDNMKLYLAYRQIPDHAKYDSNCNLFSNTAMEPYTCEVSTRFKPRAFDEDTLRLEIKKLFGENTNIPLANIRLGSNSCIGGFQYIPSRGQFVEGLCEQKTATSYKVNKKLIKATSNRNTIILTEEVKYIIDDSGQIPESLKSGLYYYTFRLDMNYNYIFISKTFKEKY